MSSSRASRTGQAAVFRESLKAADLGVDLGLTVSPVLQNVCRMAD